MIDKKITLYSAICDSRFVQIFGFVILGLGLGLQGPWGESGPQEKNPFNKQAEFGPRVLAHESSPSMKKPDPNLTCCHSYSRYDNGRGKEKRPQ